MGPGGSGVRAANTGSSHRGRPASDFSTFPLTSNIIYIPSLWVKVESVKDDFPLIRIAGE